MKYRNIKTVLVLMSAILLASCQKDLDLSPQAQISDKTYWKSVGDFETGANAFYSSIPGMAYFDVDSDIAFNTPNNISNSTLLAPATDGNWINPYSQIRNCNNLMEKVADSDLGDEIKVYVAEAKFFRAFNYWLLFRLYGGVPLVDKTLDIKSPELYSKRNSRKETVDFIIQDLRDAISTGLPKESAVAATDKGRITEGAAYALLARVALFEGTWAKSRGRDDANYYLDIAIDAANQVMISDEYDLYTGKGTESYRYLFIEAGDNSKECILDRRYEYNVSPHDYPPRYQSEGLLPTKKLADMYLCRDGLPIDKSNDFGGYDEIGSEFENRDPRMSMTIMPPKTEYYQPLYSAKQINWPWGPQRNTNTGYILFKYMSEETKSLMEGISSTKGYGYDRHVIRYAEVLLIYAEATYERYGTISDNILAKTINQLRTRAGLNVGLTNEFVTTNSLRMRDEIRRERTVELALEGFRWDDLRRWKTAEDELIESIRGIKIVGTEWQTMGSTNNNVYYMPDWQSKTDSEGFIVAESAASRSGFNPDKHYLRPIPTKEILLNPNLRQNPKW